MPTAKLSGLVTRLGRGPDATGATDADLLGRFVAARDDAAFAELVRRHGRLVYGVCRRVTGGHHPAEDAFQAVFVVLAAKAAAVRPPAAVGAWLYGVAVRTALRARTMADRRRRRETPVGVLPDAPAPEPHAAPDAVALLDEEVARLPDRHRLPVVLCELEGATRRDAARRLGVNEGTLSSRLAAARKALAARLRARGVALSAAGLSAALARAAGACPPAGLAAKAAAAATPGTVPAPVAALSHGVLRLMFLDKLKAVPLAAAAGGLLAWAALAAGPPPAPAPEPPRPPARPVLVPAPADDKRAEPAARPAGPGALVVARKGPFWVLSPDGKTKAELDAPEETKPVGGAAVSPDGKRVAFVVNTEEGPRPPARAGEDPKPWPFKVVVRPLGKADGAREWDLPAVSLSLTWAADGKKLIASKINNRELTEYEAVVLDPETGKTEKADLPPNVRVLDCGRDGKTFLVQAFDAEAEKCRLGLAAPGDKKVAVLCDLRDRGHQPTEGRLSPDGRKVLFVDGDPDRKDAHKWGCSQRVYVLDVAAKKPEPLADFPDNGRAAGVAWSPDGRRVAYTWAAFDGEVLKKDELSGEDVQKETEGFLMVADADGRNAKTVATDKGRFALGTVLGAIDWR